MVGVCTVRNALDSVSRPTTRANGLSTAAYGMTGLRAVLNANGTLKEVPNVPTVGLRL